MSGAPSLLDETRALLRDAVAAYAGTEEAAGLQSILDRLDDPLRVAIAGRVKAGKSTLLNALVGEELAPTDAGECTKIVTWYRDGVTY
ncbi:MAG: dynamin family protein, partial [Acidimicrobiia bacterium]